MANVATKRDIPDFLQTPLADLYSLYKKLAKNRQKRGVVEFIIEPKFV